MARAKKIILWALGIIVGLIVVVVVGFNIYIRATYASFYDRATEEFEIPGIHAGFICQDLDHYDEADCWFFSGYAAGDGASPLYRRDADGSSVEFFAQLPDGSPYTDHGSGITSTSEYVFLTCDSGYLVFDAAAFAQASAGDQVRALDRIDLELTPAFLNIENDTLYAGTFHLLPNYEAPDHHHLITPDGTQNAGILLAYPAANAPAAADADSSASVVTDSPDAASTVANAARYGFSAQAACAVSLPDKVQGVCVLPDGDITLSTSYGFNTSHLLTYRVPTEQMFAAARALSASQDDPSSVDDSPTASTFTVDGRSVPLYFLDSTNLVSDLEAPPMTEGIEFHDGCIWVSEESASNKYLFGKLYGAGDVFSLPVSALAESPSL